MRNITKGFLAGLIIALVVFTPACRTTRKKNPTTPTTATTSTIDQSAPTVTVPNNDVKVDTQPPDFVQDQKPVEEQLPRDIERLNTFVRERGYVRDAFFGYDEAGLSSDAQEALSTSASWLKQNPKYNLLVEGHCDERGTEQYNLALGDKRANIAKEYLATLGVDSSRIKTVSYGEERPFNEGHSETSWAENRRAHLVVVESGR